VSARDKSKKDPVCCSMLQRVAVCCSVVQWVAACYRMLQRVSDCGKSGKRYFVGLGFQNLGFRV